MESLWLWDGARWHRSAADGPVPQARSLPALAYDSARRVLVLFGGMSPLHQSRYGDVWELATGPWQDRSVADGPGPRDHHACAFDEARGELVVYGGQDSERKWSLDTWLWNGRAWRRVEGAGPGERAHHAMAYDSARKRVVLHGGGGAAATARTETWEWDGASWTAAASDGPSPRTHARLAYDAARGVTVLFGGRARSASGQYGPTDETWLWDGSRWRDAAPAVRPSARVIPAMAYDRRRQRVVMYSGGATLETTQDDIWEWDGVTWARVG
jgi:hypothetical protein